MKAGIADHVLPPPQPIHPTPAGWTLPSLATEPDDFTEPRILATRWRPSEPAWHPAPGQPLAERLIEDLDPEILIEGGC